jgi:hypothetical protein
VPLTSGKQLGRYQIVAPLGAGGRGISDEVIHCAR